MARFALIPPPDYRVVQFTDADPETFGNPGGVWHDVTDHPDVEVGWIFDPSTDTFSPPPPPPPPPEPEPPSNAVLAERLAALEARVAALEQHLTPEPQA